MESLNRRVKRWHFDLDHYLNPFIPLSPLPRLPAYLSRFLGYRKEQEADVGNVVGAWWSGVGAFCGLAVIAAVFDNSKSIQARHPPAMIASFGASAILEYNAIRSPLGQPRNAVLGHMVSALVGVGITKLFLMHPDFESIKWIAGAVSCGVASAVMLLTGTVHPPGGASAVLAATDDRVRAMGWDFVGLVMLGTTLMVIVGLVVNNLQRQFPVYWWTPVDLRALKKSRKSKTDVEAIEPVQSRLEEKAREGEDFLDVIERRIHITAFDISLPKDMDFNTEELEMLENLRDRLKKRHEAEVGRVPSSSDSASTSDGTMLQAPEVHVTSSVALPVKVH